MSIDGSENKLTRITLGCYTALSVLVGAAGRLGLGLGLGLERARARTEGSESRASSIKLGPTQSMPLSSPRPTVCTAGVNVAQATRASGRGRICRRNLTRKSQLSQVRWRVVTLKLVALSEPEVAPDCGARPSSVGPPS